MSLMYQFAFTAFAFIIINIVTSILIVNELSKRGIKINYFLIRLLLPKYAHQYRKITLEETGKAGGLYYLWIVSINLALFFAVLVIIFK